MGLALPLLWGWARLDTHLVAQEARASGKPLPEPGPREHKLVILAGLLFAGDLFFWHISIVNTTVANATFLMALAPIVVVLGSWTFLREPVGRNVIAGLLLAMVGIASLLGSSYQFAPRNLIGDLYGVITALFFGFYFLAVRPARKTMPAGVVIFRTSVVTAAVLLVAALIIEGDIMPSSLHGAAILVCLAVISHAGGQGLLAFALGHLPAAFSSLVILLEGVAAAILGWLILGEHLTALQLLGCIAIFAGIYIARPRPAKAMPQSAGTKHGDGPHAGEGETFDTSVPAQQNKG